MVQCEYCGQYFSDKVYPIHVDICLAKNKAEADAKKAQLEAEEAEKARLAKEAEEKKAAEADAKKAGKNK